MIEGFGLWSAIGLLTTIGTGWLTPTNIETYIGMNYSPYSQEFSRLKEPIGYYGIQTDIHENVRLFFEHQSSPRMSGDHPGLNHAGVKFLAPVTHSTTAYLGISDNSDWDTDKVEKGILTSAGVELGGQDIKFFTEYIAPTYDLGDGRIAAGVKLFFR